MDGRIQNIKNIDNVNLDNLEPNMADIFGWEDRTTGKNYWLVEQDGYVQITPMIKADIVEVRPVPLNKGDNNYGH